MMQRHGFDREHVPEQIEKKWKLFNHFKTYMQVKLYQVSVGLLKYIPVTLTFYEHDRLQYTFSKMKVDHLR